MGVAVKKLPPTALETDVRKLFKGLDSISDVRIICDKMGACTGLAFAEFLQESDVEAAAKRDGMSVLGNTLLMIHLSDPHARVSVPEFWAQKNDEKSKSNDKKECEEVSNNVWERLHRNVHLDQSQNPSSD